MIRHSYSPEEFCMWLRNAADSEVLDIVSIFTELDKVIIDIHPIKGSITGTGGASSYKVLQ